MNKHFGDRLKELRIEMNLTQEELAKSFGTGKSTISHYESNRRLPDANIIASFADFFNVSLDYIMGKSDLRNIQNCKQEVDDSPKSENMYFAERLRYLMVTKDLTADLVSKDLGIDKDEFLNYAKGVYFPNADILKKIAGVFETSLDYLVGVTNDYNQHPETSNKLGNFLKEENGNDYLVMPDYIEVAKTAQDKKVPAKVLSDFIKLYLNRDK